MAEVRGYCTLCRSRCGAVYTIESGRMRSVAPDAEHPTGAAMCPKGRAAPEIVHHPARLTRPLRRTTPKTNPDPGWREIGWDEALDEIAARLAEIRDRSGPEAVAFSLTSPSGTPMVDSIDWVERFIRLFGSPNTVYGTELCNWHKDVAHALTFGTGLPTADYAHADLAVLWGHNPAKVWLAQSAALARGRSDGTRLTVVDPRRSTSATQADRWLRVRPGTYAALALGTAQQLLATDGYDEAFVRAWSNAPFLVRAETGRFLRADDLEPGAEGYVVWDERSGRAEPYDPGRDAVSPERFALRGGRRVHTPAGPVDCVPAFARYAEACEAWSPARTAAVTGVGQGAIVSFADDLAHASSVAYATWTGVAQHADATQTERAIATLFSLVPCYDVPGGNVVLPHHPTKPMAGLDLLGDEQRAKALGAAEFPLGPPASGWVTGRDLCRAVLRGDPYPVRALMSFGGNLLLSQPDPARTADTLRALEFAVHTDLFENPTSRFADILLPVNSPWEREAVRVGFEISHEAQERIQLRPRMVEPAGESRSDAEIVFDLADRLGMGENFYDGDLDAALDDHLSPLGLTVADLRDLPGGVSIPLPVQRRHYAQRRPDGTVAGFATPTRRVELYSERLAEHGYSPVPEHRPTAPDARFPLVLTCAKNGYFCNSQHRALTSLRKRSPEPRVDISAELADARGVCDGDLLEIETRNATVRMRARIDESLHPDVVLAEYGWWQEAPDLALPGSDPLASGGWNYNLLIDDDDHDPISGAVPMRSASCDIRRVPTPAWPDQREFTVDANDTVTADIVSLRLRPSNRAPLPDFRPGQHVTIATRDDPGTTRSYSLISTGHDHDDDTYAIAVKRIADGRMSTAIHERLRPGDRVLLTAPTGLFAVPTRHAQPVVMLAAGIGITPFLGYLETLARTGGAVPEVVLHHGSRSSADHAFAGRIDALVATTPTVRVVNHYSRPADGDLDRDDTVEGRLSADAIDADLIERRARFYLCGPEQMLSELTHGLVDRGVPTSDIFTEKFHARQQAVAVPDNATATVAFSASDRELTWSKPDGTLLELAESDGLTLPSGCRLGQCESCAVRVVSGSVTHLVAPADDFPDDHCLTCQAIPTSDLVLDA